MKKILSLTALAVLIVTSIIMIGCISDDGTPTTKVTDQITYDHEIQGFHSFEMMSV